VSQAKAEQIDDNERVRITVWSFDTGDSTGQHRHGLDYVVVPVTGGTFDVTSPNGEVNKMTQELGVPYFRSAGAVHDVTNRTDREAVFVEIELKEDSASQI
jgi:quercetin dioxygenase-like cupin family protein